MHEQDKAASQKSSVLHTKVVMQGLGREKKRLQHNNVDLSYGIPTPDRRNLHGGWMHTHTHTHTHTHQNLVHISFRVLWYSNKIQKVISISYIISKIYLMEIMKMKNIYVATCFNHSKNFFNWKKIFTFKR